MSAPRDALAALIRRAIGRNGEVVFNCDCADCAEAASKIVDAFLAKFDVVPRGETVKPSVEDVELPTPAEARQIRILAGISQEKLAQSIGCSSKTVSEWELGRAEPGDFLRPRYARVLAELSGGAA